ncbi:MAG TPA: hypothetical protein VH371_00310 [Candidatus Limnocylindrales bacterium]
MLSVIRSMPSGVKIVLGFGFVLLAGVGLTLPLVINQAVEMPVSPLGLLWMLLLAYLIFTLTLILQRKQAAWMLSIGLASLAVPIAIVLYFWAGVPGAIFGIGLVGMLFTSLRGQRVREWFSEQ